MGTVHIGIGEKDSSMGVVDISGYILPTSVDQCVIFIYDHMYV